MPKSASTIAVALLIALAHSCAAEKITADPNAPGVGKAITDSSADARLARKVSYEASHKPLKTILADLSTLTGVTLNAGLSKADWQVRDRRMNVFVEDLPLAAIMNSIARVMKFKWTTNDEKKPPTYRLVMDRKSIGRMEEENSRKDEELRQEIIRRRHKLADTMAEIAAMSDSQIAGLQDKNPYLYLIGKTGLAKLTTAMFKESPRMKDTWVDMRRNMLPPVRLLSSETRELLVQVMRASYPYWVGRADAVCPAEAESGLDSSEMAIENIPRPFTDWERNQLNDYGGLECFTNCGQFRLGYYANPDSAVAQRRAAAAVSIVDDHSSPQQVLAKMSAQDAEARDKDAQANDEYLLIEPRTDYEPDPDLQKKLEVNTGASKLEKLDIPMRIAALQKAMSEASGFGVVSDSFAKRHGSADIASGEIEFQKTLDSFAKGLCLNWEKHGAVIEMHSRDWFRKRAAQIPDEWAERWRTTLKKTGTLTLDEFCQIAMLTSQQIDENILTDPVLKCCGGREDNWNLIDYRGLIHFYLRTDADQRAMMFSPAGLTLDSLTPEHWQAANAMLHDPFCASWYMDSMIEEAQGRYCMKASIRKRPNGTLQYVFVLSAQDPNVKPKAVYGFDMPRYEEPNKTETTGVK